MRFAYLDESGFSNPSHEPYAVVAGVLVHGDRDIKRLEEHLFRLGKKLLPDKPGVIFHAKDIYHGSPPWNRERFSREQRWQIITKLCSIPAEYDFPVLMGVVHRERFAEKFPGQKATDMETAVYCMAAGQCIMAADSYLRNNVHGPRENAMVIAEDRQNVRTHMRNLQAFLQSEDSAVQLQKGGVPYAQCGQFPLRRIVDTVHFAAKTESSMLQLADACAFAIKRRMMGRPDGEVFCKSMYEQMAVFPKEWPPIVVK